MKKVILGSVFLFLGLAIAIPATPQEAGENINVLPVVPQSVPNWEIKGDGYLQRQVEPTIAASTRNPDHLLTFFNDYRAVDVADDSYVGEEQFQVALLALNVAEIMMAGIIPNLDIPVITPPPVAAAEAWVGMSRSYDGGLTWSGGFLPGFPFDEELNPLAQAANRESPVYGLEAATDPVLAPAPCGYFYLVFMAFTRGDQSKLAVARYQDLNNDEGGDTIQYQGTTVLEVGNNAEYGYFLDKPDIEVDVWRGSTADQCAHRVYVSYSTFNGLDKDGKFQSKINFAASTDFGETFGKAKLNPPYNQNQGSALAVDPTDGTIYMTWRHFFDPDAILITSSSTYGAKWNKPVMLTVDPPMAAFDQPTLSTDYDFLGLAFRTNGFPTAAVTDQHTVFVAWQERVDGDGIPSPGGSPRIVLMRSNDRGATWSGLDPGGAREAVDNENLDKPYNAGVGGDWQVFTDRGPQVQPRLSFGGGRLMLAYYESRGLLSQLNHEEVEPVDLIPAAGSTYITSYDRVMDFRAALLDPVTGALEEESSSIQVSRYPIRADADLARQNLDDVAFAHEPCSSSDPTEAEPPCARQVNRVNLPTSDNGSSPFIGDYPDLVPMVQFVKDGTQWRWATGAGDVPYRGFHAIFTDNRHIVPPWDGDASEYLRYSNYGPPGIGDECTNAGSRNSDVLTARITADVVVSTPTTYKEIGGANRSFPFSINNRSDEEQYFHLAIAASSGPASFSPVAQVTSGDIKVFPYSSVSQVLYVDAGADPDAVFKVEVYQAQCENFDDYENRNCQIPCLVADECMLGTATFNADRPTDYGLVNLGSGEEEAQNPFVLNPFVLNPFVLNSSPSNPFVLNPFVLNPFVLNSTLADNASTKSDPPAQKAYEIIDTTWMVQPNDDVDENGFWKNNTASTQLPVINVDNAEQYAGNYAFQLIVYKSSSHGGYNAACEAYKIKQDQILSNVYQNPFVLNPFVLNPFVLNPFVLNDGAENPFVLNPFVLNSTFTMAPPDDAVATSKRFTKEAELDDGTVKAPRAPNEIMITLRAYRLKPFCTGENTDECIDPDEELIYDPRIDPPSAAVASLSCIQRKYDPNDLSAAAECFDYYAPDLVPTGVDEGIELTAELGGSVIFPDDTDGGWYLQNQGKAPATAENVELRHGFYLSADDVVDLGPDGEPTNGDRRIGTESSGEAPVTIPVTEEGETGEFFTASELSIPSDIAPGEYMLILYVDDMEEVSEVDEINNKVRVKVPITITEPNTPPVASDQFFTTNEDTPVAVPLNASDPDGDELTYEITSGPSHGTLSGTAPNLTYTPNLNFNGTDSFTYTVSDDEYTATAKVTITVAPVTDYVFEGFFNPWTEVPPYQANAGSAIPLKWRYRSATTGLVEDSSTFDPTIESTFYEKTDPTCPTFTGTNDTTKFITTDPDDPGSSELRYSASSKEWQLNWATPTLRGCYYLRVFNNLDGLGGEVSQPLLIILK